MERWLFAAVFGLFAILTGGCGKSDSPAIAEAQQKFLGAVDRPLAFDELGREERERLGERRAQVASQIGHRADVGDTVAVNPPEDLARPEALVAAFGERLFERGTFQVGEVGAEVHG